MIMTDRWLLVFILFQTVLHLEPILSFTTVFTRKRLWAWHLLSTSWWELKFPFNLYQNTFLYLNSSVECRLMDLWLLTCTVYHFTLIVRYIWLPENMLMSLIISCIPVTNWTYQTDKRLDLRLAKEKQLLVYNYVLSANDMS